MQIVLPWPQHGRFIMGSGELIICVKGQGGGMGETRYKIRLKEISVIQKSLSISCCLWKEESMKGRQAGALLGPHKLHFPQ